MATEIEYQEKVRNCVVPAVYVIISGWGESILLCRRRGTGYMDGKWDLPSGHIEPGELPTEAAVRETEEEVGVILSRKDLQLVHTSYRPKHDNTGDRADYVFVAEMWGGKPRVCEPDKCEQVEWFGPNHIIRDLPVVPHVKEFIRLWKKGVRFSELDLKWLKAHGAYKL